jgi:hypothetical protein
MAFNKPTDRLTAAQEILLGADDLDRSGKKEFSEWDLTVASWKRNPNRFGCRGYEDRYPDHKRVMMEIMGTTKKDNPIRRGWLERTRSNHYQMTNIGRSEADLFNETKTTGEKSHRSPQPIYDAVAPLYRNSVFRKYCSDPEEPRMWLGAASFLGLTSNDPQHVEDRRKATRTAIDNAIAWLTETNSDSFRRGVSGGEEAISKDSLSKLKEFLDLIEKRFANQIEAIKKTKR